MPRPTVIELTTGGNEPPHWLIFQSKTDPLLNEEIHGDEVWPNRCPDDGTLFLEGCPEDYVGSFKFINLFSEDKVLFYLTANMVRTLARAETCSFGDTRDTANGGTGPGFTYIRGKLQHDNSLGVSSESSVSLEAMGTSSGIVVLIDRPPKPVLRKYYDEDDVAGSAPTAGGPQRPKDQEAAAGDVDMDGRVEAVSGPEDDLAGRMKTLRLKGR